MTTTHSPSMIRIITTNIQILLCLCLTTLLSISVGGTLAHKNQLGTTPISDETYVYASGGTATLLIALATIFVLKTIRELYRHKKQAS